jgi:hypothetical protein
VVLVGPKVVEAEEALLRQAAVGAGEVAEVETAPKEEGVALRLFSQTP